MKPENKNYAIPITMMFGLFFMIGFVTGLPNPMGVIVKNQFGTTNFLSSLGNAANFIAYAFMGVPAGMLLRGIGYKNTALWAIVIGFTGIGIQYISGQSGSFLIYLLGAFVSGFSMCMLNAVVNPMLNTLGGGGRTGNQFIQLGGSLGSIGATIAPVFVGFLMGDIAKASITDANPALFVAMGIFALAFLVLFAMDIPEPHRVEASVVKKESLLSPLGFRHFALGALAIGLYVGIEVGIPNTTNLFMTTSVDKNGLGIAASDAGAVVGTYWFLMLIGRLAGSALGSRFSSRSMLTVVSIAGMTLVLMAIISPVASTISMPLFKSDISVGLTQVPVSVMYLILCGLCTSVMWGGIFNLAVEGLGRYTAMASGIFMVLVCGGGIIASFQSFLADHVGYMASYWVIFICFAYLLFYALLGSKNVSRNIPV